MISKKDYWQDIDINLEKLVESGAVKLPSLKLFNLDQIADEITNEMGSTTFKELCKSHKIFLDNFGINEYLAPKLLDIARKVYGYNGSLSNQYHIARKVEPGNLKENYRAHFDSHIFTMVIPIKIPIPIKEGSSGELIYFPNARSMPKNEINNFIVKAYYKKYASRKGLQQFSIDHKKEVDSFTNYQPLLFLGKTTLHTNYPVSNNCPSYRLTLLAHFFDDSPKYGIGSILRLLRNR